jgi:hypothetical protein
MGELLLLLLFEILFSKQPVCLFLAATKNFTEFQVPKSVLLLLIRQENALEEREKRWLVVSEKAPTYKYLYM